MLYTSGKFSDSVIPFVTLHLCLDRTSPMPEALDVQAPWEVIPFNFPLRAGSGLISDWLLQGFVQLGLENLQGNLYNNLLQYLSISVSFSNCFALLSSWNIPCFNSESLSPGVPQCTSVKIWTAILTSLQATGGCSQMSPQQKSASPHTASLLIAFAVSTLQINLHYQYLPFFKSAYRHKVLGDLVDGRSCWRPVQREGIEYLSFKYISCHEITCPTEKQLHVSHCLFCP